MNIFSGLLLENGVTICIKLALNDNASPPNFILTWGLNSALRGASNRKLKFKDLNLSCSFGAEDIGPLARCSLLVL